MAGRGAHDPRSYIVTAPLKKCVPRARARVRHIRPPRGHQHTLLKAASTSSSCWNRREVAQAGTHTPLFVCVLFVHQVVFAAVLLPRSEGSLYAAWCAGKLGFRAIRCCPKIVHRDTNMYPKTRKKREHREQLRPTLTRHLLLSLMQRLAWPLCSSG